MFALCLLVLVAGAAEVAPTDTPAVVVVAIDRGGAAPLRDDIANRLREVVEGRRGGGRVPTVPSVRDKRALRAQLARTAQRAGASAALGFSTGTLGRSVRLVLVSSSGNLVARRRVRIRTRRGTQLVQASARRVQAAARRLIGPVVEQTVPRATSHHDGRSPASPAIDRSTATPAPVQTPYTDPQDGPRSPHKPQDPPVAEDVLPEKSLGQQTPDEGLVRLRVDTAVGLHGYHEILTSDVAGGRFRVALPIAGATHVRLGLRASRFALDLAGSQSSGTFAHNQPTEPKSVTLKTKRGRLALAWEILDLFERQGGLSTKLAVSYESHDITETWPTLLLPSWRRVVALAGGGLTYGPGPDDGFALACSLLAIPHVWLTESPAITGRGSRGVGTLLSARATYQLSGVFKHGPSVYVGVDGEFECTIVWFQGEGTRVGKDGHTPLVGARQIRLRYGLALVAGAIF